MYCARCKKLVSQHQAVAQQKGRSVAYYCPECKRRLINLGREQGAVSTRQTLEKYDRETVQEIPKELKTVNFERSPVETRRDELLDILKYAPDNTQARFDLALLYYSQKKLKEALEQFEQVLAKSPDHGPTLHKLLNIYTAENTLDQAIAMAERLVALEPENQEVLFHQALLFLNSNALHKAAESLRLLTERNPDHEQARVLLNELENMPLDQMEKSSNAPV